MDNKLILLIFISLTQVHSAEFSYYIFATEWAGSICNTRSCNKDKGISPDFWNIHGLWPSDGSKSLNFCSDEHFNKTEILPLQEKLDEFWSGLYANANSLHGHEWVKHGTCSGLSQIKFFSTALEISRSLDIYKTLSENGITPGNTYNCSDVAKVIREQYGIEKFGLQGDKGYLNQIKICHGKSLAPQDCPKASICEGKVIYPNFTP